MLDLYSNIVTYPQMFRQFSCGRTLITEYDCPLGSKKQDLWSEHNYIVRVVEGRKIWHTAQGSFDLQKGSCVFVRKGACIVEQFFDAVFCNVILFLPDDFIAGVVKSRSAPLTQPGKKFSPVMPVAGDPALDAFFISMSSYFGARREPDASLLELKFREIVLTIAENPANATILSYFHSLLNNSRAMSIRAVMEENFCYNLRLEEFARLSSRSLSAFKRDFVREFGTTPGKWLLEKRLEHARHLLLHLGKSVGEASFESGFENPSHFSRAFRQHFGVAPTAMKPIGAN